MRTIPGQKNQDIQCLRAIAIIVVMAQHFRGRLPSPRAYLEAFHYVQFWTGVDIFFAISGFLVCKTFLAGLEGAGSRQEAFIDFWIRRAIRLLPALYFWLAVSVAVSGLLSTIAYHELGKVLVSALSAVLAVSNLYWAHCVQTDIQSCGNADFNGVTWSLSLEWQLYAILACTLFIGGRRAALFILLILSALLSFYPLEIFSYPWAFRPLAFTLGVIVYLAIERVPSLAETISYGTCRFLLLVGLALCLAGPVFVPIRAGLLVIGLGAVLCLISSLKGNSYSVSPFARPLIWVGERSYSIYLCHLLCILITHQLIETYGYLSITAGHVVLSIAIFIAMTLVLSDLSYRLIEQRLGILFHRNYAKSTRRRRPQLQ
ncbi:acyltransferase family protein [Paraburkholderia lycopersici]|uniref:Peptidoglycan/LPS O-acetylase OafA/YrhL, contains acyltransferase and SGNH-hydrolase domains n=1 Tax=Paraburkholderia lycopersici TaxID=416944 RepID=A0A1G7A841_9BURK|nr:acyltransferase [Paraburkholderia lycopersici]SDE11044.1 Peptidoglycan/LPS O-acetylase OafA/YrhL, contains acyltransferase and SGNH-hydrolase domains [Paraburkholderia lycopersici]